MKKKIENIDIKDLAVLVSSELERNGRISTLTRFYRQ